MRSLTKAAIERALHVERGSIDRVIRIGGAFTPLPESPPQDAPAEPPDVPVSMTPEQARTVLLARVRAAVEADPKLHGMLERAVEAIPDDKIENVLTSE